ncbi:hypothetical protein QO002_002197 [Pararhizobium capsulatum DSM 1112]|uniref:Transposase n=1 Tax=Pararhizobium capsulatum DSM 1112 TaxID=1121113 RepID=A0ABU0BP85_9HYPH|nr:hypothetical protein [Pararhizobium capsulatum]MDQ0320059.1 hypothetical protein [Pararhizobium capsulatum DSM 1112]
MAMNENGTGLTPGPEKKRKPGRTGLHPLHEAAMRIAELGIARPRSRTKDLVTLLLTHGARAWRSTQPHACIHVHVTSPSGRYPIRLRVR